MSIRTKIYALAAGSDRTGDGTLAKPFKSVQAALQIIPPQNQGNGQRYVIQSDWEDPDAVSFPALQSGQSVFFNFDGSGDVPAFYLEGYVTIQAIPTVLVTLAPETTSWAFDDMSDLATVSTGLTLTPDQYKGKMLLGSGPAEIAVVASNTADGKLVTDAYYEFTAPITICDRSAAMNGGVDVSGVTAPVAINGVKMVMSGDDDRSLSATGAAQVYATACEIHNTGFFSCGSVYVNGYIHGAQSSGITGVVLWAQSASISGYVQYGILDASAAGNFNTQGIYDSCPVVLGNGVFSGSAANGQVLVAEFWGLPLTYPGGGAVSFELVNVRNVAGKGIVADGNGLLTLMDHVGVDTATVVGGLHVVRDCKVQILRPASITPTGSDGSQLQVDSETPVTWAAFYGGTENEQSTTSSARCYV